MRNILKFLEIVPTISEIDITFTFFRNQLHCCISEEKDWELDERDAYRMLSYLGYHLEDVTKDGTLWLFRIQI